MTERRACPCGKPLPPKKPREHLRIRTFCSPTCRARFAKFGRGSHYRPAPVRGTLDVAG